MKIKQEDLSFPKPPDRVVMTWEEIAKYTPYGESRLRKRFGPEMFKLGVVFYLRRGRPGGVKTCGFIWKIQRYFWLKGQAGEL